MTSKRKIDQQGRECTKCGEYKLWSEFHIDNSKKSGHVSRCTPCSTETNKRHRYIDENGRECTSCLVYKNWNHFYKNKTTKTGFGHQCKDCLRKTSRRRMIINVKGRECTKCGQFKTWDNYRKNKHVRTGFEPCCKSCKKELAAFGASLPFLINQETGKQYKRGEIINNLDDKHNGNIFFKNLSPASVTKNYSKNYRPIESYKFDDFVLRYIKEKSYEKGRAMLKNGKPDQFDLTDEHLLDIFPLDMICPIYGVEMTFVAGKPNSIELDKMDRDRGYVIGNVAWISAKANRAKSDSSKEELQKIVNFLESKGL